MCAHWDPGVESRQPLTEKFRESDLFTETWRNREPV
jgi:hypothetical protein